MKSILKDHWIFLGLALIQGVLLFCNQDSILFWDTIQFAGKHTTHFYEYGFQQGLLLPDGIDSGHPPTFAWYLSLCWKIFGKSLTTSHWAMFPFLLGIFYKLLKIGELTLHKHHYVFALIVFLCPFYLGHSILVSPDLILLLGFLVMLRGHLSKRKMLILIGSLILSVTSLRGMALIFSFFLYDVYTDRGFSFRSMFRLGIKKLLIYLPAVFLALSYLLYHYYSKGWISHHPESPWSSSYAHVDFRRFLRNILFMGYRLMDFGMLFIYVILLWKIRYVALLRGRLIWLWLIVLMVTAILVLPYQGLLNHRYFLPLQIIAILIATQVMVAMNKKYLTAMIAIALFSGNFWIYPDRISQGWDSTWAHQAFYKEVDAFQAFAKEEGISTSTICTVFPLKGEQRFINLDDTDKGIYKDYHKESCKYVLYSTVMNDYTDEDLEVLKSKDVIYQSKSRGISIILYQ